MAWHESGWQATRYGELARRLEQLARALISMGIAPGDRVAVLGANSPAWGTAYLAIQRAGATAVPLDRLQAPIQLIQLDEHRDFRRRRDSQAPGHHQDRRQNCDNTTAFHDSITRVASSCT